MKKRINLITLFCGALMAVSCEPAYEVCDSREVIIAINKSDVPIVVELVTPTWQIDTLRESFVSPSYIMPESVFYDMTHLGYNIDPNGYPQRLVSLKDSYGIWPGEHYKDYTCQMIEATPSFRIGKVIVFNLADTSMTEFEFNPEASFFQYDSVYFDVSYKQQPGGMMIHELYLIISDSTLSLMEKDTTMLSRFAEYYGR